MNGILKAIVLLYHFRLGIRKFYVLELLRVFTR